MLLLFYVLPCCCLLHLLSDLLSECLVIVDHQIYILVPFALQRLIVQALLRRSLCQYQFSSLVERLWLSISRATSVAAFASLAALLGVWDRDNLLARPSRRWIFRITFGFQIWRLLRQLNSQLRNGFLRHRLSDLFWFLQLIQVDKTSINIKRVKDILVFRLRMVQWSWVSDQIEFAYVIRKDLVWFSSFEILEWTLRLQNGQSFLYFDAWTISYYFAAWTFCVQPISIQTRVHTHRIRIQVRPRLLPPRLQIKLKSLSRLLLQLHSSHGIEFFILDIPIDLPYLWLNRLLLRIILYPTQIQFQVQFRLKLLSLNVDLSDIVLDYSLYVLHWVSWSSHDARLADWWFWAKVDSGLGLEEMRLFGVLLCRVLELEIILTEAGMAC